MLDHQIKRLSPHWEIIDERKLRRVYQFKSYLKVLSQVNAIGFVAQQKGHHPDLEVSFNQIIVSITTHDEGNTLTEKDFQLAYGIDQLDLL